MASIVPGAARLQPGQDQHAIFRIDRHLAGRILRRRPLGVGDVGLGHHGVDRAGQMFHEVQHVRGQVGDHASARRPGEFPTRRGVGVGAAGVQVGGAELEHAAQAAFVDQLLRPQRGGKEAVSGTSSAPCRDSLPVRRRPAGLRPTWPPRACRSRYAFDGRLPKAGLRSGGCWACRRGRYRRRGSRSPHGNRSRPRRPRPAAGLFRPFPPGW